MYVTRAGTKGHRPVQQDHSWNESTFQNTLKQSQEQSLQSLRPNSKLVIVISSRITWIGAATD
jgi:hypothetical protein